MTWDLETIRNEGDMRRIVVIEHVQEEMLELTNENENPIFLNLSSHDVFS